MKTVAVLASLVLLLPVPVMGAPNAAQNEARAQHLFTEVRCVVCQGEDIADSDADIAADMRRTIRADIEAGQSDAQIRQVLVDHYGDYVLFRPRATLSNLILWSLPPLIVLLGALGLFVFMKKQANTKSYELNADERKKLADLLNTPD